MTEQLIEAFIPLTFLIALGYALGRLHPIDLKSVATLAIYAITPIVAFGSAARLEFSYALLLLPLCTFALATMVGLASFAIGNRVLKEGTGRYLLPAACGSGNTGYFGLPVAMALFGPEAAGLYFLANLGVVVFETSIGYYFIARGSLTRDEALRRVVRLPVLYALAAGLLFAASGADLPDPAVKLWEFSKGAYIVVGMMIAGLALAQSGKLSFDLPLFGVTFLGKFLLWPLAALAFAALDPGLFPPQTHQLVLVLSLVPVAANLPAYAAASDGPVASATLLVMLSTAIAILGLPLLLPILL